MLTILPALAGGTPALADDDDDDKPAVVAPGGGPVAQADDDDDDDEGVDSENIFGFTEGTDTGEKGEKELSNDTVGAFGRREKPNARDSRYTVIQNETEFEYGLTDDLTISASATIAGFDIHGIRHFDNISTMGFGGLSAEVKWRILDRRTAPIGLSVSAEPEWSRFDEASGERLNGFSLGLKAMADAEIMKDRLFAAANLLYEPEWSSGDGEFERESGLEISGALSARVLDNVFAGAEARYVAAFDGAAFDTDRGHAFYLGPTLYADLTDHVYMKGAWSFQVAGSGRQGIGGGLNSIDFDRQQARLQIGVEF